ncbi:hypothetical protein EIN_245450 [Entamoeba invadens IP1]|uniref:Uncharacterized protein n=1 Tax=Entamoeba invadens IP1 TaxID=370355 RepID=L7FLC3_ENTIV|nr:hypothetical protein EIN_245450 [Entamoeba invadens IP1]ELP83945.1 hypothetical protein EIN_245450 [Entamoeba invadens IP1]|eukprot:XP_004183291.1 hypothetical protein EIN_245450 [Entamoeba invadens IP1]
MSTHISNPSKTSKESSRKVKVEKKRIDETRYTLKKREVRNLESYQQALLLALVNKFCGFTLEHPGKRSKVTASMPRLYSLQFPTETIEIKQLAQKYCEEVSNKEEKNGISKSTSLRRFEKNKRVYVENLLFDICLELGFWFDSKPSRKSQKSLQIERICSIYYKGILLFSQEKVLKIGKEINTYIMSKLVNEKKSNFKICDNELIKFLDDSAKKYSTRYTSAIIHMC